MLAWFKKLFGRFAPASGKEAAAAVDKSGAGDVASKLGSEAAANANAMERGNTCKRGHAILPGQRNEDCFDCHLINLMIEERKGIVAYKDQGVMVGSLLCLNGFHRGHAFSLVMREDVPIFIGADPDCDVVLSDEKISRRHLTMVRRQGRTTVRDTNSLHHSAMRAEGELQWYVLDPEREYWFRDGCHIMLGDIEFLYRATDEAALKMSAAAI